MLGIKALAHRDPGGIILQLLVLLQPTVIVRRQSIFCRGQSVKQEFAIIAGDCGNRPLRFVYQSNRYVYSSHRPVIPPPHYMPGDFEAGRFLRLA